MLKFIVALVSTVCVVACVLKCVTDYRRNSDGAITLGFILATAGRTRRGRFRLNNFRLKFNESYLERPTIRASILSADGEHYIRCGNVRTRRPLLVYLSTRN
jgi:hypothetical protein